MENLNIEIEELAIKAEQIASLSGVLQEAFSYTANAAKDYTGAISLLSEILWAYKNDMCELMEKAFQFQRKDDIDE